MMKNLLEQIFSVKYEHYPDGRKTSKVIRFMGIKIKFVQKYKQRNKIQDLEKEVSLLRILMEKSIDITKIPKTTGNLRKVQLIKTKILELVDKVLKENNITYWLDYGTLIGAIRHQGFIPWDDDIDVCMLKDDYLKLPEVFGKIAKSYPNCKLVSGDIGGYEILRFYCLDFCIDFFPMEYIDKKYNTEEEKTAFKNKWLEIKKILFSKYDIKDFISHKLSHLDIINEADDLKRQVFGKNYSQNKSSSQIIRSVETLSATNDCSVFDVDRIFPLKEGDFEGLKLPIPNDPIEHLYQANLYGARGDVMNFPTIKNSGFHHTFDYYKYLDLNFDEIYSEISSFVENYR